MKHILLLYSLLTLAGCATSTMGGDQIQAYRQAIENGQPVFVEALYVLLPNSAGGVTLGLRWHNLSDESIKYVEITAVPYNAVGDSIASDIGSRTTFNGRIAGPIEPKSRADDYTWRNVWYNRSAAYVELTRMEIEYMNGSTLTLEKEDIDQMYRGANRQNSCEYQGD